MDDAAKELIDQLKDAYKENVDLNFKLMAILLLVIGWFTADKNPLANLCSEALAGLGHAAPWFAAAGYGGIVFFFSTLQKRSQAICDVLRARNTEAFLYERWRITRRMLWVALLGQLSILLGIFFFLLRNYSLGRAACPAAAS